MKRPPFINSHIYHIYNRGVEKRKVFLDDQDRFRFVHDLYEFNDEDPVININYRFQRKQSKYMGVQLPYIRKERKLLVDILVWCLMPNHFHLIIRQRIEDGIVLFMQKLGSGYTNYFNLKYKRVGPLFQGKFKAILIENDNYLKHLSRYIHLNPLELTEPNWKTKGIKNLPKSSGFLEKYRWSSYLDYIGKKNFPSVIQQDFINEYFNSAKEYKKFIQEGTFGQNDDLKDLILE
ncbi:MAG: transposase [Candidatus Paceibacterota bacterium]|jgi:putative transposase